MDTPTRYKIRVEGHLDSNWAGWFEGFTIANDENGEAVLTGEPPDQAALHGILRRIGSLGLTLISLNAVPREDRSEEKE